MLRERLLQLVQLAARPGQRLDGLDRAARRLDREHEARAHGLAVEEDVAVAAEAVLAGEMRALQAEVVAEEVGKRLARLDLVLVRAAVDLDAERCVRSRVLPRGRLGGVAQRAAGEHGRDTAPVRGGDLDVVLRRRSRREGRRGLLRPRARRGVDVERRRRDAEEDEVGRSVERDDRRGRDLAVVAVAGADLVESGARAPRPGPGSARRRSARPARARSRSGRGRTSAPGSSARAFGDRTSIAASSATAAAVSSAHGAAKASEPPTVPRRRVSL